MMRNLVFLVGALLAVLAVIFFLNKEFQSMDTFSHSESEIPTVKLQTSMGDITLELYPQKAPTTVKNFLEYVQGGHYDNTIFHRVIEGFMIQGGGYTENLTQKPTKDPIANEANNGLKNKRGTIAMARTNVVDSATSQFFINAVDNQFLDFKGENPQEFGYCVFGKVIKGVEIVDQIQSTPTQTQGPYHNLPVKPIKIIKAQIMQSS